MIQDDPTYTDIGRGFVNSLPAAIRPAPGNQPGTLGGMAKWRFAWEWAPTTTAGAAGTYSGGPAYDFPQTIRYTGLELVLPGNRSH